MQQFTFEHNEYTITASLIYQKPNDWIYAAYLTIRIDKVKSKTGEVDQTIDFKKLAYDLFKEPEKPKMNWISKLCS